MPDDLYSADIVVWSQTQADLLRRAAHGERVSGLDWPNLIEEIESVGRSQIAAVESLLRQALVHLLKSAGWPNSGAVPHWRAETIGFLADAAGSYAPSMRQRIDVAALYRRALRQVQADRIDGTQAGRLPHACPFTLDELLDAAAPIAQWIARLAATEEGDDAG